MSGMTSNLAVDTDAQLRMLAALAPAGRKLSLRTRVDIRFSNREKNRFVRVSHECTFRSGGWRERLCQCAQRQCLYSQGSRKSGVRSC